MYFINLDSPPGYSSVDMADDYGSTTTVVTEQERDNGRGSGDGDTVSTASSAFSPPKQTFSIAEPSSLGQDDTTPLRSGGGKRCGMCLPRKKVSLLIYDSISGRQASAAAPPLPLPRRTATDSGSSSSPCSCSPSPSPSPSSSRSSQVRESGSL